MNTEKKQRVCPVERAGGLDNSLRRLLQNPGKILKPYIRGDMKVLDLGCGPGFFTIEIAKMLGDSGKVIAADLQEGMLNKLRQKITGSLLEKKIELHKCEETSIGVVEKVDFILAFWMVHEVPDHNKLFNELKSILNTDGNLFIIEPNFHVSKKSFGEMINTLETTGFQVCKNPKVFFSRSILLKNK
jgi:ubiquinone/menaquinone biosynthesis C-methylase UbiE